MTWNIKKYIGKIIDTNICVSNYFNNNKIKNILIEIPGDSFIEFSFIHHPMHLPSVSFDDHFDSEESNQLKDQFNSCVIIQKVTLRKYDSILNHHLKKILKVQVLLVFYQKKMHHQKFILIKKIYCHHWLFQ